MASITKVNLFGNLKRLNKHGIPPVPKSKRNVVVKPPLTIHGTNGSFVSKVVQPAIVVPVVEETVISVENHAAPVEEEPKIEAPVEKPVEKPVQNWKAKRENKGVVTAPIKE